MVRNSNERDRELPGDNGDRLTISCMETEMAARCNKCMTYFTEEQLLIIEDMRACPTCKTDEYLMDIID